MTDIGMMKEIEKLKRERDTLISENERVWEQYCSQVTQTNTMLIGILADINGELLKLSKELMKIGSAGK